MDVLSDAVATIRAGRPHSARAERSRPFAVRHDAFGGAGFHVVLEGSCCVIPPDGGPIVLGVGDVVFLPHGAAHAVADSPATPLARTPVLALPEVQPSRNGAAPIVMLCGAYLLDRSRPHPLLAELPDIIHLPSRVGRYQALRTAIDLLGAELEQPRPGSDGAVPSLLDLLLLYILRAWFDERADHGGTGWAAALRDPAVAAALRAIHGDPGRPWTVEGLGAQGGLSRAAFARRFTALVGQPPLTYLAWWRMTIAAKLLRDSDAPLGTIAREVGYGSQYAFAHAFKRECGLAPGAFRNT
ncbi:MULTISPECIES: AraC family transcriptional regulator [Streptomyces]|uniref:AraC family transcriptional regulator n=2 Tax=Streptomyces TaxID=1883 RepID=A0ABV9IXU3_9ACTN